MNLLETRIALVNRTGRFDLVKNTEDYVDNGANSYIQEAARWLDRKYFIDKAYGRFFKKLSVGAYGVLVPEARVIKEVWIADSDSRKRLRKFDLDDLRGPLGYNKPFSQMDKGRPISYAPTYVRMVPETVELTIENAGPIVGYADVMIGQTFQPSTASNSSTSYNGILFMPPTDGEYSVEVVGFFYSMKMTKDEDQNQWSVVYPDVLLMATCRQLEIFNRNTEGVNDWTRAVEEEMFGILADGLEEQTEEFDQMEG